MSKEPEVSNEETLDPEDWESLRVLGHRMLDDALDYQRTVRERPPWQHATDEVAKHFRTPLPLDPQTPEDVYEEFLKYVLPYPVGNIHPRFWGWVFGNGTVFAAFAEMMAAAMNSNSGGLDYHSANYVEQQVIDWVKEMLKYPLAASGLLTSGCSAANLIGLTVARNAKAGHDIRREGLTAGGRRMMLYASSEIHSSIAKAVELLGLGHDSLRLVPVNANFQIDIELLKEAIDQDRCEGHQPFCVIGAAGTTNTGAIDDLKALADICELEDLWLHVDGAFGAWAALVPEERQKLAGMELADSLALDMHKWMYLPYEIGIILVRSEEDHRKAFSLTPAYLAHGEGGRGMTGGDLPWLSDYGFQLSRGFRALKAWMSLKEHGVSKYSRLIRQNIEQARYLGELIEASFELELAAPVTLNVVCFRFIREGMDDAELNRLNKQIEVELQEQGVAVLSVTTISGKCVLRVASTNHRSRREDFEILVREVIRIGNGIVDSL